MSLRTNCRPCFAMEHGYSNSFATRMKDHEREIVDGRLSSVRKINWAIQKD